MLNKADQPLAYRCTSVSYEGEKSDHNRSYRNSCPPTKGNRVEKDEVGHCKHHVRWLFVQ